MRHGYVLRALLVALGYTTFEELPGGALLPTGYIQLMSEGEQFTIADVVGIQKTTEVAKRVEQGKANSSQRIHLSLY